MDVGSFNNCIHVQTFTKVTQHLYIPQEVSKMLTSIIDMHQFMWQRWILPVNDGGVRGVKVMTIG